MADGNSAVGLGLQGAAGIASILGMALGGRKAEKRDRRIARGEETPELRALRSRLAAQNTQTAMQVAASQPGVNPALAQRNAQQALSQAQVQTNAQLAGLGVQQASDARGRLDASRHRRIQGSVSAAAGLANSLGASMTTQSAQDQRQSGSATRAPSTGAALPASDLVPQVPNSVSQAPATPATTLTEQVPNLGQAAFGQGPVGTPVVDTAQAEVGRNFVPEAQAATPEVSNDPGPSAPPPALPEALASVDQVVAQAGGDPEAGLAAIDALRSDPRVEADPQMAEALYQKALLLQAQIAGTQAGLDITSGLSAVTGG